MASNVPTVEAVLSALGSVRFSAVTEEHLQVGIDEVLSHAFPGEFVREFGGLTRRDRPDFYCKSAGIALEVKFRTSGGSPAKVFAQLARYAESPAVRDIILATSSRRVASLVGDSVGGKTIHRVLLCMGL